MDDMISRQAAIDILDDFANDVLEVVGKSYETARKKMCSLPSAQPERKTGKWIQNDNGTYSCSLCHSWIPEEQHYYARYCLYCGAKMRSEDNG